jgi:exopolysaccharide biosynthesis polyprenyl glycosylphosphotransferase
MSLLSLHRRENVLILGTSPLALEIARELSEWKSSRYRLAGLIDDGEPPGRFDDRYPILGPIDRLASVIENTRIHRIVVALTEHRGRLPVRRLVYARMRSIDVEFAEEFYERLTGKLSIESLTPGRVAFSSSMIRARYESKLSRLCSFAGAAVALTALSPVIALVALAVRMESPGPVLFVQERIGLRGRPFHLFKFRTMRPAKERTSEWARDNGHRVTGLGRWLRKFRLDELPQFYNILRGDMNLIGPRPHPATNFTLIATVARNAPERGTEIPYYSLRSLVRPGITGWAQVRYGYANGIEEEIEKLKYDLYYVKHHSLWLDLRIVFETIRTVLMGQESRSPAARPTIVPESVPSSVPGPVPETGPDPVPSPVPPAAAPLAVADGRSDRAA